MYLKRKGECVANPAKRQKADELFLCTKCTKAFVCQLYLDLHTKMHYYQHGYACDADGCEKTYTNRRSWRRHRILHRSNGNFACPFEKCSMKFRDRWSRAVHVRRHVKERPYTCDFNSCTASFVDLPALRYHKRAHTNERPYQCADDSCAASFKSASHALRHYRACHIERNSPHKPIEEERVENCFIRESIAYEWQKFVSHYHLESHKYSKIDFVVPTARALFLVEVDEQQHTSFNGYTIATEQERMIRVSDSIWREENAFANKRRLVWIRYNPHAFQVDGVTVPTFKVDRERALVALLRNYEPWRPLTIIYLYYSCSARADGDWGSPVIFDEVDYQETTKRFVDVMTRQRLHELA